MPDYADVWDQYDLAVSALYDVLGPAEAVSLPPVRSTDVSHRADLVITRSAQLADAATRDLNAPRATDRELATLRLVASSAADLAIANDLMHARSEEPVSIEQRAAAIYPQLMADLGSILRPGNGTATITPRGVSFGPPAKSPTEALSQLNQTAGRSFDAIADDVIDAVQMAISGLVALPADQVEEAAAVAVQEILNMVTDSLGTIVRRAALLLVRAYDKVLKALGQEAASEVRQQATRWIQMLESETTLERLLWGLYERQRILENIQARAQQAPQALMSDAFSAVLSEMHDLSERFRQQRQSIEWVLRGLAFTKGWLFTIEPWGPLAVTAMYVSTLGYTVYAGGDYVDWFRTEQIQPLKRVPGLRDIVRETLVSKGNVEQADSSLPRGGWQK